MSQRTVWVVYKAGTWIIDGPNGFHKEEQIHAIIGVYTTMDRANEVVCGPGVMLDDPEWLTSFASGYSGRWGNHTISSVEVPFIEP